MKLTKSYPILLDWQVWAGRKQLKLHSTYYAPQKEVPPDTGLVLFTISSRQSSTVNESHLKVKFCAALPRRNCKQSEPGVTGNFFLGRIVHLFNFDSFNIIHSYFVAVLIIFL